MATPDAHALAAAQIDRYLMERALRQTEPGGAPRSKSHPVITISRTLGTPGTEIARKVADELGFHFLDRQILDIVAQDAHLGEKVIASLDEGCLSALDSWFQGLVDYGSRLVDPHSFHHMLSRVVRGISHHGNAVILGRGANFILRGTDAYRVRITAPAALRAEALVRGQGDPTQGIVRCSSFCEARKLIVDHAERRRRFITTSFRAGIDDPESYDAVFSLRDLDPEPAAKLVIAGYRQTVRQR